MNRNDQINRLVNKWPRLTPAQHLGVFALAYALTLRAAWRRFCLRFTVESMMHEEDDHE